MKTSDVIVWLVECLARDGDKEIKDFRVKVSLDKKFPHQEVEIEYLDGKIEARI